MDAVQRQQAHHMSDGDTGLTRFDAGNGLDMHAQTGGRGGLAITGACSSLFDRGAHVLDCLQRISTDVCRNTFPSRHGRIVTACGHSLPCVLQRKVMDAVKSIILSNPGIQVKLHGKQHVNHWATARMRFKRQDWRSPTQWF